MNRFRGIVALAALAASATAAAKAPACDRACLTVNLPDGEPTGWPPDYGPGRDFEH